MLSDRRYEMSYSLVVYQCRNWLYLLCWCLCCWTMMWLHSVDIMTFANVIVKLLLVYTGCVVITVIFKKTMMTMVNRARAYGD